MYQAVNYYYLLYHFVSILKENLIMQSQRNLASRIFTIYTHFLIQPPPFTNDKCTTQQIMQWNKNQQLK